MALTAHRCAYPGCPLTTYETHCVQHAAPLPVAKVPQPRPRREWRRCRAPDCPRMTFGDLCATCEARVPPALLRAYTRAEMRGWVARVDDRSTGDADRATAAAWARILAALAEG